MKKSIRVSEPSPEMQEKIRRARHAIVNQKMRMVKCPYCGHKGTTGGLEVVMRSIIYAAYSKDLSVKTTTAKIQMMKQGKYVGGYAPYGYVLHPEIRNKLKLDPEAAEVVRRVFDEALQGMNTSQIALGLNDDNILTPGQYFKGKHPDNKKFSYMSDKI